MIKAVLIGSGGQLGTDVAISRPSTVQLYTLTGRELDVKDERSVFRVLRDLRPHVVINAAAYVNVDGAEDEPAEAFAVNAFGVRSVAGACADIGASLVHISTDFVFSGSRSPEQGPYSEDDGADPLNAYGLSKYAGEQFVRAALPQHYIVRTASLYGKAGSRGKGGNFVYSILQKARRGEPIKAVSDITMSPTCTSDLALLLWDLIWEARDYGIYHGANEGACTWYDFACAIIEYADLKAPVCPISWKDYPFKARRPLWTPLRTARRNAMRPWREALKAFIDSLE